MEDLQSRLRERYPDLTDKQRRIAGILFSSPTAASYSTVAEVADAAGVTKATVVRFCQGLGYPGYSELRNVLRGKRTLERLWPLDMMHQGEAAAETGPGLASLQQDAMNLEHLLSDDFPDYLAKAVTAIAAARQILIISAGSHAGTALMLAHNLNFIGRPAQLENRGSTYLGQALSNLTPKDLVISIVFWFVPTEVTVALEWCRDNGIPTLAITDRPLSGPARTADLQLLVHTESVSFFRSQTAAMAAINALLSEVAATDRERTVEAISRSQGIWEKLKVFRDEKEYLVRR